MNVLDIVALNVSYSGAAGELAAVRDLSLAVRAGQCLGVVGESGAGKSQAFMAIMGLLPVNARVTGSAALAGVELIGRPAQQLDRIRGKSMAMVFQDPLTALTPHLKIGRQIAEPLMRHQGLSWHEARQRSLEFLARVHVPDPVQRLLQYPHELSGGMRQRVTIAMALVCNPALLIADEPTTALDVTIQAQILALLAELKRERGMAMVLISHDFGAVAGLADRVAVMQGGRLVEEGATTTIFTHPSHPHTQALLKAMAPLEVYRGTRAAPPPGVQPLLQLADLRVQFLARTGGFRPRSVLRALAGVDLSVAAGESVGIVGESGSGKSTLARAVLRLLKPTSGRIVWLGRPIEALSGRQLRPLRRDLQIVFQDPLASLDPRMTVSEIVSEPLLVHEPHLDREAHGGAVAAMLQHVGLSIELLNRYPHELSGGQCQRVGIARAMILKPKLLVCDEAVSALDLTTQAQIVTLIELLRREYGLTLVFISHNLAIVRQLCDRVLVLYLGRPMELAATGDIYAQPAHPYSRALLSAVPRTDPALARAALPEVIVGEPPSSLHPPSGCVFRTRCPWATELCASDVPAFEPVEEGRWIACHHWRRIAAER